MQLVEVPMGGNWLLELAMFNLGHSLTVAGGLATAYREGHVRGFTRCLERQEAAKEWFEERKTVVRG